MNDREFRFDQFFLFEDKPGLPTVSDLLALTPRPAHRPRRILLISDVHGNWHALVAVVEAVAGRYDSIIFLGDAVGYGPRPLECVDYLIHATPKARWRAGNHDLGMFGYLVDSPWSGNATFTLAEHRRMLEGNPQLKAQLRQRVTPGQGGPTKRSYGHSQQVFTHANLDNNMEVYLFPRDIFHTGGDLLRLRNYVTEPSPCAWMLVGHTHVPCLFRVRPEDQVSVESVIPLSIPYDKPISLADGHYLINPGSVGQPRDGNRDAAYALLDVNELTIEFGRVPYDDVAVAQEMYAAYGSERAGPLAALLQNAGTPKTHLELMPYYSVVDWGLKANPEFGGKLVR